VLRLPGVRVLERAADGRGMLELVGGPHDGTLVVVGVPTEPRQWPQVARPRCPSSQRPTVDAEARATVLLESMLDPDQLASWRRSRCFWVPTRLGPVRLGSLYQLEHLPGDGTRRFLCVVPHRHLELPTADIWVNLLLVLAHRPEDFFRRAVVRRVERSCHAVGVGGTVPT
jgi:hypothetical protein